MANQLDLFRHSARNQTRNWRLFSQSEKAKNWKTDLLYPQAVVGGYRSMAKPHILYKSAQKRVMKYSRETYALEMTGVNHLGVYHLSKHLFNLSFLKDPYLRDEQRSSIEVVYQLANYHLVKPEDTDEGLFLRPMVVVCDDDTKRNHPWSELQKAIRPLTDDVEISLPFRHGDDKEDEHWFYPLVPLANSTKAYVDPSFVTNVYSHLVNAQFLQRKEDPGNESRYRIRGSLPIADETFTFPDDWRFGYGRHTGHVDTDYSQSNEIFSEVINKDIVLHQNSSKYYGPLKMHCYGCGNKTFVRDDNTLPEDRLGMEWYDLDLTDPRTRILVEEKKNILCELCEGGEYKFKNIMNTISKVSIVINESNRTFRI